jgi:hypothetical protein
MLNYYIKDNTLTKPGSRRNQEHPGTYCYLAQNGTSATYLAGHQLNFITNRKQVLNHDYIHWKNIE